MQGKRIVACRACHRRKVKCSGGGPPCSSCAETKEDCVYPVKDRKTRVGQRYLSQLQEENERLTALVSALNTPASSPATDHVTVPAKDSQPRADNADRNPLIEERPWFIPVNVSDLPIHIGEAADAAFATRLRQTASSKAVSHLPRIHFLSDDSLRAHTNSNLHWPSASRIRYLIEVALNTVCKVWHLVRRSVITSNVEALLRDPESCDWLTACRLWALLALGEAYSARCTFPDTPFPGSIYFAKAMAMVYIPSERPRLALVEVYLLLSVYASAVNRRHTATLMASYALRVSVILGLHIEISENQLKDKMLREHRCRLWWTAYCFDRMWASKIGWPPSIQDENVEIGLPSDEGVPLEFQNDLHDAQHVAFVVRLAQLANNAVSSLYVRRRQPTTFSERVQTALRALSNWADDVPERLKLNEGEGASNERHVLYMHLTFNQSVIVTTRPVLLHILRQRRSVSTAHTRDSLSESAAPLISACIRCARTSLGLLKTAWTDGTIATFDYFNCQYIFSSATIMALSCLLRYSGWMTDFEDFAIGVQFLQQLDRNGNYAAKEYYAHIEALRTVLTEDLATDTVVHQDAGLAGHSDGTREAIVERRSTVPASANENAHQRNPNNLPLQEFLNNPAIDLDFMDTGGSWLDWGDIAWQEFEPLQAMP